jgi:hypothetical protein
MTLPLHLRLSLLRPPSPNTWYRKYEAVLRRFSKHFEGLGKVVDVRRTDVGCTSDQRSQRLRRPCTPRRQHVSGGTMISFGE